MNKDYFKKSLTKWSALTFTLCTLTGYLPPPRQPFVCNDGSLGKSFSGDTISVLTLFVGVILGPLILFSIAEGIHHALFSERSDRRKFFRQLRIVNGDYLLGLLYLLTLTELAKTIVGELRPHFFESCMPDWKTINCSAGPVKEYRCTGKGPDWLVQRDIYKSFPSGHAALSFYCFVFTSMYSQVRIPRSNYSHLLRSWVQLVFLFWACVCSLTRITDNRHHWWDVLIGSISGILGGYFTVLLLVQNKFLPKIEDLESMTITATNKSPTDKMTSL